MRRFRLRRLWRVKCEALMRAAGQNLKRLLKKRRWGRRPWPEGAADAASSLLFGFLLLLSCPLKISFELIWALVTGRVRAYSPPVQISSSRGFFNRLLCIYAVPLSIYTSYFTTERPGEK